MTRVSYPYRRSEECSWQPEEVSRQLSLLASSSSVKQAGHENLLSRGWSSQQVGIVRDKFGSNVLSGDEKDQNNSGFWSRMKIPCLPLIFSALVGQLKEPLILMLLGSAAISIALGNSADAISIGIALFIVSLVAAVQEYRSEQALEKLAHLVPHTCTVLRDGRVMDRFFAKELVVGDLILLATGE